MGKIVDIGCITRLDIPVDKVLEEAKEKLDGVVLIGWDMDGDLYAASTYSDGGEVLWLLEKAKQSLLEAE